MNLNLSSAVKSVKTIITANSPALLVGTAIAGVVATGVMAAKGGYNARGIIDNAEIASDEPLTFQEKAQLTWKCYLIPGITGASTVASVIGVHTIHNKRHAAMAGLYAVATTKLDDMQEEAERLLGPKKSQDMHDSITQRNVDRNPPRNHEVMMLDGGTELCLDKWSGRYFMGSLPHIEKAFSEINLMLAQDGSCTLNDFYDYVGLPPIPMGYEFGWSGKGGVEPRLGKSNPTAPDGRAVIEFEFSKAPKSKLGVDKASE